jgi:transcriptional regulator with XRE-family HTH domain
VLSEKIVSVNVMNVSRKQGAILKQLGLNIKRARLRRNKSMKSLSDEAGISVPTLRAVESGDEGTSIGAYLLALFVLGLEKDLARVAYKDDAGNNIMDSNLGERTKRGL